MPQPRTPTAIKLLRGNPGKRRINRNEPKPQGGADPPAWLDTEARAEWDRVAGELTRLGLLTALDRATLAVYCQSWADFVTATKQIQAEGRTVIGSKGAPVKSPWVRIAADASEAMLKAGAQFGMSPAARSKLEAPVQQPVEDEHARFFGP